MIMAFGVLMGMFMRGFFFAVDMGMGMGMFMFMGVYKITMAVRMGVDVGVFVGVLQGNGILNHKEGGNHHDHKSHIKRNRRPFSQDQHTKCGP